jgi:AbrB family looped-hinge helix DNA binding protein
MVENRTRKASNGVASREKMGCCKVESLINVDERGQMLLPKELRDKANIHPGDKLALVS